MLKKYILILFVTIFISSLSYSGPRNKLGLNAADELLIPVGSIGTSLQGSNLASTTGIESMYWNPAGLAKINSKTGEAMFSYMNYIAYMSVQYAGGAVKLTNIGVLGFSIKNLNFGDPELVTTVFAPEGTGETFKPTYIIGNLSFARAMTDKINFGTNIKYISENIANVSATGFAFDFGLQYIAGKSGIMFGIALKNLGPRMKFDGPGLDRTFVENGVNVVRRVTLQESELPTNLEIGLSYRADFNKNNFVNLSTTFMNSSYASDEYKFGLEYNYNNYLFLRGSLKVLPDKEEDEAMFGPSFGIGLRYPVGGVNLGFDYAYRIVDQSAFNSTNQFFTFNLGF